MYIEFWGFHVKCTRYGVCGENLKNARVILFYLELDGAGNICWSGSIDIDI